MINRVVLTGRLTKDVDLRYTSSGVPVASLTLAVNRSYKTENGPEADFINVVVWRKPAENTANFLKKGSLAGIEGRIETRSYEGQDGKRVFVTEVVADNVIFLEPRNAERTQSTYSEDGPKKPFNNGNDPFANDGKSIDITDDDLPF